MAKERVVWLGQAGLLFEIENKVIIIDPYLSDSVAEVEPENIRKIAVDSSFLKIEPDIIILTHAHLDHTDPATLKNYLNGEKCVTVLASKNAWKIVREIGCGNNNISFNAGTTWTEENVSFTAVPAEHSDECAIGVIISAGDKKYYITGDTLYNKKIFEHLPRDIDTVFLPVNGKGNNMNQADALNFAIQCGAKKAVPIHFGMFDDIVPKGFSVIPKIYKEINI